MQAESEYARRSTSAYLADDARRARVPGRCEPSTGIKPFTTLADQVISAGPHASAWRVFLVANSITNARDLPPIWPVSRH